ncbi:uncharacterized protein BKCO1_7800038 [Diplodia corticola]|uniref:Fucose-specific lectin n=1 Tax=Diplodia corticola TaxID=236234 RepID=A0A1J9QKX8_9PEZI|nr:uncharacterized protein BKCO1_7800038 [Diplodia corticola]OJD29542.1 hypothetical protein BKCO1_7800038 [Diplodia corticola]
MALYMSAAGFTTKDKNTSYITKEDEGNLIEQKFIDTDLVDEIFMTSGVKPDTAAVYVDRNDTVAEFSSLVYVTQTNDLGCIQRISSPDDNDPVWAKVPLTDIGRVAIHGESRIAGANSADGALMFFQQPDGSVRSIFYDDETKEWMESDCVPETAQAAYPGTTLCVMELQDALGVFYLTKERTVSGQLQDHRTGEWAESVMDNSFFEGGISSFIVIQDGESTTLRAYVRAADVLIHLDGSGKRTKLGRVWAYYWYCLCNFGDFHRLWVV